MAEDIKDYYPDLAPFTMVTKTRIPGPSAEGGYKINPSRESDYDTARYLRRPDADFYRPWIANPPNGSAFIWPLGIQGFTYSSQATTGIHHYIGDNDVDVDVVYPDELHITLTGHFPGRTAPEFMQALRSVALEQSSEDGKILALPGIDDNISFVKVISSSFTHDENDFTTTIAYSIEMIKVGAGGHLDLSKLLPTKLNPTTKKKPKGKSSRQTTTKQGKQTLRQISKGVYGSAAANYMLSLANLNANDLERLGIPVFTLPYTRLGGAGGGGRALKY